MSNMLTEKYEQLNRYLTTISKSFWFQWVPAQILGILTIVLLCTGVIPLVYLWATLVMWVLVCGLGIAVGYHRIFSHKTHVIPTWKENIILFFATFAGQGASIFWVALHRGYHHPKSDQKEDLHSPVYYGKLNAFVGWYLKVTEANNTVNFKYAVDLLRKPNHVWFHKHSLKILWGVPLLVALFDWKLALTAFWLVTLIGATQDNMINVWGHIKSWISYRNFETKDQSQNNPILGYLCWGQGWHNNHHYAPASYDFGSGVSGKWWEWDPCKDILTINKMNTVFQKIATDLKFSWNIDDIASRLRNDIVDPNYIPGQRHGVYMDPTGIAHWQNYPTNISFARNFYRNFTKECIEVAKCLIEIQNQLPSNSLTEVFLNHVVVPNRVNLIRAYCGKSVAVHCDVTRDTCINIGLKNSNTFRTRIAHDTDCVNFYDKPTLDYTMNDGDAYLISIKNAHCVEALTPDDGRERYIITYNMI